MNNCIKKDNYYLKKKTCQEVQHFASVYLFVKFLLDRVFPWCKLKNYFFFAFSYQYQGLRVLTTLNPTIRALNTLINTIRYALTLWVFHILYAYSLFSPLSQASLLSVGLRHILIFFL